MQRTSSDIGPAAARFEDVPEVALLRIGELLNLKDRLRLTQTSSRLRSRLRSIPALWTRVALNGGMGYISTNQSGLSKLRDIAHLAASHSLDLCITASARPGDRDMVWDTVSELLDQTKTLSLSINYMGSVDGIYESMYKLASTQFWRTMSHPAPRLSTLILQFDDSMQNRHTELSSLLLGGAEARPVLRNLWLKSIRLPRWQQQLPVLSHLVRFNYSFHRAHNFNMDGLLFIQHAMPRLEELGLEFRYFEVPNDQLEPRPQGALRKVVLFGQVEDEIIAVARHFAASPSLAIRCPNSYGTRKLLDLWPDENFNVSFSCTRSLSFESASRNRRATIFTSSQLLRELMEISTAHIDRIVSLTVYENHWTDQLEHLPLLLNVKTLRIIAPLCAEVSVFATILDVTSMFVEYWNRSLAVSLPAVEDLHIISRRKSPKFDPCWVRNGPSHGREDCSCFNGSPVSLDVVADFTRSVLGLNSQRRLRNLRLVGFDSIVDVDPAAAISRLEALAESIAFEQLSDTEAKLLPAVIDAGDLSSTELGRGMMNQSAFVDFHLSSPDVDQYF